MWPQFEWNSTQCKYHEYVFSYGNQGNVWLKPFFSIGYEFYSLLKFLIRDSKFLKMMKIYLLVRAPKMTMFFSRSILAFIRGKNSSLSTLFLIDLCETCRYTFKCQQEYAILSRKKKAWKTLNFFTGAPPPVLQQNSTFCNLYKLRNLSYSRFTECLV